MRQVQTPVQPKAPQPDNSHHPREGQAGRVSGLPADASTVNVTWDTDGATTTESVANLNQLGQA